MTSFLQPKLYDYLIAHSVKSHPILQQCRKETLAMPDCRKQIPPEQGQFFEFLVRLLQPQKILELGTFTGYSALAFALASSENAAIYTCDINENYLKIARKFWQAAGMDKKIHATIMSAQDYLQQLIQENAAETFDLIFIDADKRKLLEYYEQALCLIKPNGLMIVDNVLWHGAVVTKDPAIRYTDYVCAFNDFCYHDARVEMCMLPVGDGITLIKKRSDDKH